MQPFIDETGKRYGRLSVLERAPRKDRGARWKCQCDCGKFTEVDGSMLRNGNTRSCGCLHVDSLRGQPPRYSIAPGEAAFKYLYLNYKGRAIRKHLDWKLDKSRFLELTKANCHYCGSEPSQVIDRPNNNGTYVYNGIDRLNNSDGYISGNVVPCCGICNKMKGILDAAEFADHIAKITTHQYLVHNEHFIFPADVTNG